MTYFRGKCKDHALFCSIANVSFFCCYFSFILFNPVVHAQTVQEIENRLIGISEEWDAKEASGVAGNIQKLFVSADLEPAESATSGGGSSSVQFGNANQTAVASINFYGYHEVKVTISGEGDGSFLDIDFDCRMSATASAKCAYIDCWDDSQTE